MLAEAKVFDLGSGGGQLVSDLRSDGYDAVGADLYTDGGHNENNEYLSRIGSLDNYVLPYENDSFDFACSQNTFEHVQDFDTTFREVSRILKPGAYSIHMFPSKYQPIEPHVFIPGATIFQSYGYLYCWTWFSNYNPKWRNSERTKTPWAEAAKHNEEWLKAYVNYLGGREILEHARYYFSHAEFADMLLFKLWPGKLARLYPVVRLLPFLLTIHSACRMRVLLLRK